MAGETGQALLETQSVVGVHVSKLRDKFSNSTERWMSPICATENMFPQCKTAQKTMEIPQVQCIARSAGVHQVMQCQVPVMLQLQISAINHELDASARH